MRKSAVVSLVVTCLLLVGGAYSASAGGNRVSAGSNVLPQIKSRGYLRVGVLATSPPFAKLNPGSGQYEGFEVEVARLIAKSILGSPSKVKFTTVTDATRIPLVQQGDVDIVLATMTITPERQKVIAFSRPYYPSGIGVMVSSKSTISSMSQLAGKTNCNTTGSLAFEYFQKSLRLVPSLKHLANQIKNTTLPTDGACLLALQQGRGVDFIANDVGLLVGEAQQTHGLKVLSQVVGQKLDTWGIGIGKKNPDLTRAVNKALCTSFANGSWRNAFAKWIKIGLPAGWPPKC